MTTKKRLEVKPNPEQSASTLSVAATPEAPVKVVAEATGPVTALDKAKGFYHTAITVVAAVLVFLNEVTPATNFLPGTAKHWVSVTVVLLAALANFLKSNETWIDSL
jgi:hypothetical protein